MSKEKRGRKRRPPVEASNDAVVYTSDMGFVKVSELKAKLAEEAKAPAKSTRIEEMETTILAKIVEKGGRVSRTGLKEVLSAVKQEKGTKRGVMLSRLLQDGLLARVKVPGMRPFYAVTEEGAKKTGVQAKAKP